MFSGAQVYSLPLWKLTALLALFENYQIEMKVESLFKNHFWKK